jgi:hypothetical protein
VSESAYIAAAQFVSFRPLRTWHRFSLPPEMCRYCCKSLFAQVIKHSPGFKRDFRVKMWGTSWSDDKLADDLSNVIEATSIGGRRLDVFTTGKLAPRHLRLFQQYLPKAAVSKCSKIPYWIISSTRARSGSGNSKTSE